MFFSIFFKFERNKQTGIHFYYSQVIRADWSTFWGPFTYKYGSYRLLPFCVESVQFNYRFFVAQNKEWSLSNRTVTFLSTLMCVYTWLKWVSFTSCKVLPTESVKQISLTHSSVWFYWRKILLHALCSIFTTLFNRFALSLLIAVDVLLHNNLLTIRPFMSPALSLPLPSGRNGSFPPKNIPPLGTSILIEFRTIHQ